MMDIKINMIRKYGYYNAKYSKDVDFEILMLESQGFKCKYDGVRGIVYADNVIL